MMRLYRAALMGLMIFGAVSAQAMQRDETQEPSVSRATPRVLTDRERRNIFNAAADGREWGIPIDETLLASHGLTLADFNEYELKINEEYRNMPTVVVHNPRGAVVAREPWDVDARFEWVTYANGEKTVALKQ